MNKVILLYGRLHTGVDLTHPQLSVHMWYIIKQTH